MEYIGITNENDFYSQHYLDEIFEGDVADLLKNEAAKVKAIDAEIKEAKKKGLEGPKSYKTVWDRLSALSKFYIQNLYDLETIKDEDELLSLEKDLYKKILDALGFSPFDDNVYYEFTLGDSGLHLPLVKEIKSLNGTPYLWIFHATTLGGPKDLSSKEEIDPLELTVPIHQVLNFFPDYKGAAKELSSKTWREILEKGVFSEEYTPRWIILVSPYQWVLIEKTKFAQRRFLRFNWQLLLSRRENHVLQAASILIDINAFKQNEGVCRLEIFDENSFKHAQGVSQDLKYAMRRSIELLGNEAISQIRLKRKQDRKGFFSDKTIANELSSELLRYMYRLLFIFYVEARPELNYVPNKDDNYQTSYSLESLRELESVPLISKEDREGKYFHKTISNLFSFLSQGVGLENKDNLREQHGKFIIEKLNSKLFDDRKLKLLKDVVFPNYVLQQIIRWMSLANFSDGKGKTKRSGRISYAHLGVNQLGAVYEALLSYQGFFADEDLYEVKKSDVKELNELDTAYFVQESELSFYKDSEKVYEKDPFSKENRLKKYPKGSFIYRMAGRSRETSASYYTPEVLTKCVVQHAIEVLEQQQLSQLTDSKSKAEKILTWRVCEPAMGSAAFLNEATNQLAELYMKYAMKIPGARQLTQVQFREELQKVKMYIADRNLYGVDLNPTAVELGEVSVWLNALSSDKFVPSFEGQLLCGNSLLGCRREVYYASDLAKSIKTAKAHPVGPNGLQDGEIWHFLVPSDGMALYNDDDVKKIVPEELKEINVWRKNFNAKFTDDELIKLQLLSSQIESYWQSFAKRLSEVREVTTNNYSIYQHQDKATKDFLDYEKQQKIFKQIQDNDDIFEFGEFPRLRAIMNYWCSLWFWPIEKWQLLPSRKEFINDVFEQLNAIKEFPQVQEKIQTDLFESIESDSYQTDLFDSLEVQNQVNDAENNPRIKIVHELTSKLHFLHWPLRFADFFIPREDNHIGFDLTLGNPPWATVTFESAKVLGDLDPKYVIHDKEFNAKAIQDVLLGTKDLIEGKSIFDRISNSKSYWLESYEFASGCKNFFNDYKLYPELKGSTTDLFKLFLPNVWRNAAVDGVQGLLHPETPYTETNGITLRENVYHRIKKHFSFSNELKLFADVHHHTEFSVNIYGKYHEEPDFITISNLFIPKTIIDSQNPSDHEVEGIKDSDGKWNTQGHPERILHIDKQVFETFSKVFSTNPKAPILPNIQTLTLLKLLEHFLNHGRLGLFDIYISGMWLESGAQKDGTIRNFPNNQTVFPDCSKKVILNGVHLFVGTSFYKTPNNPCSNNLQWTVLDLENLPDSYLPRCKYEPNVCEDEYVRRMYKEPWTNKALYNYYRLALRERVGSDSERTLSSGIIPPGFSHIHKIESICFKNEKEMLFVAAFLNSIFIDFYVRTLNKPDLLPSLLKSIPIASVSEKYQQKLISRTLSLNCITDDYKKLWEENYESAFNYDKWSSNDFHLNHSFFSNLTSTWQRNNTLRTDLERRQALLEIDVIVAQAFCLTLYELQTCYRLGFRVMRSYEENTYYDQKGRIIYTPNNSLGIGIPSKEKKDSDVTYAVNGAVRESGLGFDDVKEMDSGTVTKTFMDDTLPGGPQQRTITYYAPFFKKDRVEDYAKAWHYFENLEDN